MEDLGKNLQTCQGTLYNHGQTEGQTPLYIFLTLSLEFIDAENHQVVIIYLKTS